MSIEDHGQRVLLRTAEGAIRDSRGSLSESVTFSTPTVETLAAGNTIGEHCEPSLVTFPDPAVEVASAVYNWTGDHIES